MEVITVLRHKTGEKLLFKEKPIAEGVDGFTMSAY